MNIKVLGIILLCLSSCTPSIEYVDTEILVDGIFIEQFVNKGGTFSHSMQYYYFTDSIDRRIFIGKFDDEFRVRFSIEGDQLVVKAVNDLYPNKNDTTYLDL